MSSSEPGGADCYMGAKPMRVGRALRLGVVEMALLVLGMVFTRREIWQLHAMSFTVSTWQEGLLIPLSAIDGAITGAFSSRSRHVQNVAAYKGLVFWGTPLFFILYVGCAALCERINVSVFPLAVHEFVRTAGLVIVLAGMVLRVWAQISTPDQLALMSAPSPEPAAVLPPSDTASASSTDSTAAAIVPAESAQPPVESSASPVDSTDVQPAAEPGPSLSTTDRLFPSGPHRLLRHPDASGKLLSLTGLPLVFNVWLPLLALPGVIILLKWHIRDQEAFRISQLGEPYLEYRKKTWNLIPYVY